MPNAPLREAATGLPKAINRRSILGALAGVPAALALPAAAMAGAPAALAALSAQTVVSPAPSTASATKEEAALIEIGRRMPGLLSEFWNASSALKETQARFDETAPLPPKPRKRANDEAKRLFKEPVFKIVRGTPSPLVALPREQSASRAYEGMQDAISRSESEFGRREIYQISRRFYRKFMMAGHDCGLDDALKRFRRASYELREVAAQAFDFKPHTRLGIVAQGMALYGSFVAGDGRVGSKFAPSLAVALVEIEAQYAPDDFATVVSAREAEAGP